jgi:molybdopterin/thiamine biosynthesis adenylyltransferase
MSDLQKSRYARQTALADMGPESQERIAKASVLVIGAGGLGSAVLPYLAGAGVGYLRIYDGDIVQLHNLHRQMIYQEQDVDQKKAVKAKDYLSGLNSTIRIDAHDVNITEENIENSMADIHLVIDCTDDMRTKTLISDITQRRKIPLIFGAVHHSEIQTGILIPPSYSLSEIYQLNGIQPPDCAIEGILGPVVGIAGSIMAWLVLEWLAHPERFETSEIRFQEMNEGLTYKIRIPRSLRPSEEKKTQLQMIQEIDNKTLLQWKNDHKSYFLLDVREPHEREAMHIGGVHMPMGTVADHLAEIPANQDIVVYCHAGVRSMRILQYLESQGYEKLYNLRGGISEWKARIGEEMAE